MRMEYYNGHLCVSYDELVGGDEPLVNKGTLKSWQYRRKIRVIRNAYGEGVYALYAYDSLPSKVREAFEERYGDPRELVKRQAEAEAGYVEDAFARNFYDSYTYELGGKKVTLPERYREQYTVDASVLNALVQRWADLQSTRNKLNSRRTDMWAVLLDYSEALRYDHDHKLPTSEGGLRRKLTAYRKEGYVSLISKKFGNKNTIKITEEAGEYIVGLKRCKYPRQFDNAQILEEYNRIAPLKGWKELEGVQSITRYLEEPSVKPLWHSAKEGETRSNLYYTRKNKTVLPYRRNSIWEGDGTKLNLYYREGRELYSEEVYMVMCVATEMWLGWAYGTESYATQRRAYKMALERAGERPYDILTDNQGGHKKLETQGLFERLALNYSNTQPYRPMSKLIEQKFGMFQAKELRQYPYFTGRNVTAKDRDLNLEWLEANIDLVPTYFEMLATFEESVARWNAGLHSTLGVPRQELYATMHNDELPAVTEQDFIRIFWEETARPSTFTSSGLKIQVDNEPYTYEVLDEKGLPDFEWRAKHTGERFAVKYDPDDMTKACIYSIGRDGERRFERMLSPYLEIVRAKQDQTAEDATLIAIVGTKEKRARMEREAQGRAIDYRMGRTYNQPRLKGLSVEENEWIEERARALAISNEPLVISNCEGEEVEERKPVTLYTGKAMKEESQMDYYTMWQEQQKRSGERVSKY